MGKGKLPLFFVNRERLIPVYAYQGVNLLYPFTRKCE